MSNATHPVQRMEDVLRYPKNVTELASIAGEGV
jgi:hypothetical protein